MSDWAIFGALAAAFVAFIVGLAVLTAKLPNEATSERLLTSLGYEHIVYTGRSPFAAIHGCSKDDVAVLHFRAVNVRGTPVVVDTCQGWPFGGAHLRAQ